MKNCAQHNHIIVIALISVQCNILSFIGLLCDITTFVIVRSRKMKTLKNYLVSTFKQEGTQSTETEIATPQRIFSDVCSSGNMAKILEKPI